jgi:hypothetical protein
MRNVSSTRAIDSEHSCWKLRSHCTDRIELFDKLYLCGEEYGSLAWGAVNSYVAVAWQDEGAAAVADTAGAATAVSSSTRESLTWYGQVFFCLMRWLGAVAPARAMEWVRPTVADSARNSTQRGKKYESKPAAVSAAV